MHYDSIRFRYSLLAKKKRTEAQLRRINQQLERISKAK